MNMTIYELARALGNEILNTEETKRMLRAKDSYESSAEAMELMRRYELVQQEYQGLMNGGGEQVDMQEKAKNLMALTDELRNHAVIGELIEAENDFNQLLNSVFTLVTSTIAGEDGATGCQGGCCSS